MTDLDLAALEELEKKATPAPWKEASMRDGKSPGVVEQSPSEEFVAETYGGELAIPNAKLIAALRNSAPAIFSRIRMQREELAGCFSHEASFRFQIAAYRREIAHLRANVQLVDGIVRPVPWDGGNKELEAENIRLRELLDRATPIEHSNTCVTNFRNNKPCDCGADEVNAAAYQVFVDKEKK